MANRTSRACGDCVAAEAAGADKARRALPQQVAGAGKADKPDKPSRVVPHLRVAGAAANVERAALLPYPRSLRTEFLSRLSATRDKEFKGICRSSLGRPIF